MTVSSQMALDNNSEKKEEVKRITSESKAMPKPNLGKAETGHEKGVHTADRNTTSSVAGQQLSIKQSGDSLGLAGDPKNTHKSVLKEIKAQPKPKIPG